MIPDSKSACEQEPIHAPYAIQPHGVLFVLCEESFTILHVSANTQDHLGLQARRMLGTRILERVHIDDRGRLEQAFKARPAPPYNPFKVRFYVAEDVVTFDAILHRYKGVTFLELERTAAAESRAFVSFFQETREAMHHLRATTSLEDLCQKTVENIRSMTGFDRIDIYQFDEHWDGKVIAESCEPSAKQFMGYHFPEGDIPSQARHLYLTSRMRAIPDTAYTPVPLISTPQCKDEPLDLSMAVLRSVSPMHREYTKQMGVKASMSVSLLHEGRLWGLLICGHEACKHFVSYEIRTACEFLCEVFTSLIGAKEALTDRAQRTQLKMVKDKLVEQMFAEQDVVRGLTKHDVNLLQICNAQGAAVCRPQGIHLLGTTPPKTTVEALCKWLCKSDGQDIFATDRLSEVWPDSAGQDGTACGVVAAPISGGQTYYILWFRPEGVQIRTWGGKRADESPRHAHKTSSGQSISFEAYHQTLYRRSEPWHPTELEAVQDLMRSVVDVFMQHSEMLERLNVELERSNLELNAFAYAASHDLKEPLRGIQHFSQLVVDELGEHRLIGQSRYRMLSIQGMATRMQLLIDALLRYAHVGRAQIDSHPVDLDHLVDQLRETLASRLESAQARLEVDAPLGRVLGDAVLLLEVLTNLVTNAIKYNDSDVPTVKIGVRPCERPKWCEVYVSDNGIGIDGRHKSDVFDIFRRLHGRDKFGGGSGAGLTIAQRIIERHGGRLTFDSVPKEGTTFYFQVPSP